MTMQSRKIAETANGGAIYRRDHRKSDGRDVFLYGYAPQEQPSLPDELLSEPSVSELRWHPFRREWSIYAAGRQNRTFKPATANDPLAPSRAGAAPTEIPFEDFELAVFENRFPSLTLDSDHAPTATPTGVKNEKARGRCEVMVYTPEPTGSLATLSQEQRQLIVHAWIDRYRALFEMGCEFILPFENRGDEVGVTLHHPHGQIYGFGFTPAIQQNMSNAFADGFDLRRCMKDWRADYKITSVDGILAFAPPFARFPYEVWIAPVERRRGPWDFSTSEIDAFAHLLGDMTRRYDALFGRDCPYMLSLHAAPKSAGDEFHFTAQFYPILRAPDKIKYLASVEQATNVFTVDVPPEQTANEMRNL